MKTRDSLIATNARLAAVLGISLENVVGFSVTATTGGFPRVQVDRIILDGSTIVEDSLGFDLIARDEPAKDIPPYKPLDLDAMQAAAEKTLRDALALDAALHSAAIESAFRASIGRRHYLAVFGEMA